MINLVHYGKKKRKERERERERGGGDQIYFTLNDFKKYEIQQNNNSTFQL